MRIIVLIIFTLSILLGCSMETGIEANTNNGLNKSTIAVNDVYGSRNDIHGYPRQKLMLQQQMQMIRSKR
jgi:hypothetical protein